MRLEEALKLKTGDLVSCNAQGICGCTGRPDKVRVVTRDCGCIAYYHESNPVRFLTNATNCTMETDRGHGKGIIEVAGVRVGDIRLLRKGEK